ncbi:hypothetical protein [Alteriqipengyuania sp.]|uniref:hypothetical protein n=1 Tax=Alteriqipengyuania sp. TaxID=2800692 RepID=UPI0035114679
MSEDQIGFIIGLFLWVGLTFFWWKDWCRGHAEVQWLQGFFTSYRRSERPSAYRNVTIFRAIVWLILTVSLIKVAAEIA